jgi:hypothetical protein
LSYAQEQLREINSLRIFGTGTHCVMPLLSRLWGQCHLPNTREEVDSLAQALIKAQGFFA